MFDKAAADAAFIKEEYELAARLYHEGARGGDAYASQGPLIHELSIEDGRVHLVSSEATEILLRTENRRAERRFGSLTEADFTIRRDMGYFRFEIVDKTGKRAVTRAYDANRYGR